MAIVMMTIFCLTFVSLGMAEGAACVSSTHLPEVVQDSYPSHAQLIRRGVPMEVVRFFYELALKNLTEPDCICPSTEMVVDENCVNRVFTMEKNRTSAKLVEILERDSALAIPERLFPAVEPSEDLPAIRELEEKAITEGMDTTVANLMSVNHTTWSGASFPSDELLRFDRNRDRACEEFAQKMDQNSLWLPATALSAYVLGITQQIFLLPGSSSAAETMLMEHIRMVYLASRCRRVTGNQLRVPVIFLEGFITRAHLALKNCSTGPQSALVVGFPKITAVEEIIRGSRHFFPDVVKRISSLNSFGRSEYVSWNSTSVVGESLKDVMLRKAPLQQYNNFYSQKTPQSTVSNVMCGTGFQNITRLIDVSEESQYCCSKSCVLHSGSIVKRSIINEMCCECCNEDGCNVDDLAQVIQAQAYGFDRERESSVANVW